MQILFKHFHSLYKSLPLIPKFQILTYNTKYMQSSFKCIFINSIQSFKCYTIKII